MARVKAAAVHDAAKRRAEIAKRKLPGATAGDKASAGDAKTGDGGTSVPPAEEKKKKKRRYRSKMKWVRQVRKEQGIKSCKPAIPRAALNRIVRDIAPGFKFGKQAISALRVASNQYGVELMQRSNTLCVHSNRQEIALKDVKQAIQDMNREDIRVANHSSG